ncbi:hypothetical protein GR131_16325 [Streptomyces sp. GF20]|uniref:hypothetical protein n=1 Tax=Streptomyces sp. GF20 TaxID=2692235 RepID=UPI0013197F36|nr:hypothetical protein [Streptomyces sp. GF20]QHC16887.1 hypothetical protein GR131_16325 [Streptomyces sp. GF20]
MNAPLAWLGLALLLTISAPALIGRRYPRITPVDSEPCDRCTGGPGCRCADGWTNPDTCECLEATR